MGRVQVKRGNLDAVPNYTGLNGELIWAQDAGKLFITDSQGNKRLIGGEGFIVETIEQRDDINPVLRQWRMIVGVYNDPNPFKNGQYELVYNLSDTNPANNENWRSLNKHVVFISQQSAGVVTGGAHQLSNGVVPVMYARDNDQDSFRKIVAAFELDPENGDLSWSTSQQVFEAYLVLI
ncbi:MAG: hypothetical protein RBS55_09770 [Bacteroidales bacterium]|jgi:hypothetical protein|nr:hypothetical protein [Bacteroidales bacterium]